MSQIDNIIETPLSNLDLDKIFSRHIRIIEYKDIPQFSTIDDFMGGQNFVFIFIQIETNGHWELIFKNNKIAKYQFFDSYGFKPDFVVYDMQKRGMNLTGQIPGSITRLFGNALEYNKYAYQSHNTDVNTCGRWCCLVEVLNHIFMQKSMAFDCQAFHQIMIYWKNKFKGCSYDDIVANMINLEEINELIQ